jgi:FKBP-type peptidyl-prolyl cis-trans isomerase FkpA
MKKLLNLTLATILGTLLFTSCNKNEDNSYEEEYQKELARIDSTNKAQAPILKTYAEQVLGPTRKLDSASGIWFEELLPATDNSYSFISATGQLKTFLTTAKYSGRLVPTGTEFSPEAEGNFTSQGVIPAWQFAYYPKSVTLDNIERKIGGITANGLKTGAKIRIIAPSTLCYDKTSRDKIPANSPLDFTIEVKSIN